MRVVIHTHIYTHLPMYCFLSLSLSLHIYIYTHVHIEKDMCVYIYTCVYKYIYAQAVLFPLRTLKRFKRSQACSINQGKKSPRTDNSSPHLCSRSMSNVLTISSMGFTAFWACPFPFRITCRCVFNHASCISTFLRNGCKHINDRRPLVLLYSEASVVSHMS